MVPLLRAKSEHPPFYPTGFPPAEYVACACARPLVGAPRPPSPSLGDHCASPRARARSPATPSASSLPFGKRNRKSAQSQTPSATRANARRLLGARKGWCAGARDATTFRPRLTASNRTHLRQILLSSCVACYCCHFHPSPIVISNTSNASTS